MEDEIYNFEYIFCFSNGTEKRYKIVIDSKKITLKYPELNSGPEWTKLEYHQCSCCPYTTKDMEYCPLAVNIAELVEEYKDTVSFESCVVTCVTDERTYVKDTSIQDGLFSILGLINATSNCPHMEIFRPMARFHLPFSTLLETIVRVTSFYLLQQYFEKEKGNVPDLDLEKLDKHYNKIQKINQGLLGRIQNVSKKDADKNAIVVLFSISQLLTLEIDGGLNSIEYLFNRDK